MFFVNTDLYQLRMARTHLNLGSDSKMGVAEAFFRNLPTSWDHAVMSGAQRMRALLNPISVEEWDAIENHAYILDLLGPDFRQKYNEWLTKTEIFVRPNGSRLFPKEPVVQVVAPLPMLHLLETQILSILNSDVKVASKAARIRKAAGVEKTLLEFGTRRTDMETAKHAAYAAMVGGFNATSNVAAALHYGLPCSGTMAHAFVQSFETEYDAFVHFLAENQEDGVLLIDTYDVFQGCGNAIKAAWDTSLLLKGVRIDSGDFNSLVPRVRELLDIMGFKDTKILLSNDIDEYTIKTLNADTFKLVDGFGVGTKLVAPPEAPSMGFVYKFVEVDGKPVFKKSATPAKQTLPGRKRVFTTPAGVQTTRIWQEGAANDLIDVKQHDNDPVTANNRYLESIVQLSSIDINLQEVQS